LKKIAKKKQEKSFGASKESNQAGLAGLRPVRGSPVKSQVKIIETNQTEKS
jgi:hypothetical protein